MEEVIIRRKIKFVMLIGASLHKYGSSSDRIEKALLLLSEKLKLDSQFFSTPTSLLACFKIDDEREFTRLRRLDVGKVNLKKLLLVDQVVDKIIDDSLSVENAMKSIYSILNESPLYKGLIVDLAYAIVSFNICVFIGGTFWDAGFAGICGFLVGVLTENIKVERLNSIIEGVLAFLVAFTSLVASHYLPIVIHPEVTTIAALIILIPGLMLTTSISELASNNLTSGTARLLGAIMILLKITFGVYLAQLLARSFNLDATVFLPVQHSIFYSALLMTLTAVGFVISYQARFKEYYWICAGCVLTFLCSKYTSLYLGFAMSAFISGAFIAAFSNFFSRISKKPSLITLLPGITLLVPGSIGYSGIESMINQQTVEGIDTILKTFLIAVALVSGTFFGSILVKPRRSLDI